MKRLFGLVLILALAVLLSGCGSKDNAVAPAQDGDASPSPSPVTLSLDEDAAWDGTLDSTGASKTNAAGALDAFDAFDAGDDEEATPAPEAQPTPALTPLLSTEVDIKDYELVDYTDETLGISLKIPSHWSIETSSTTLTFTEPVSGDKVPMRLALTVKSYTEDKMTVAQQKKEFTSYVSVIKESYDKYKAGKKSNKMLFMNRSSMSTIYTAKQGSTTLKGYITMSAVPRTKQIVALHYSAPNKKYKSSKAIFKKILYSVTPVGVSVTE